MEEKKKINKKTLIIVGIILLLVVCGVIYILIKNNNYVDYNDIDDEITYETYEVIYEHNTEVTYLNPNNNGFKQNLKISDGKVIVTNQNTNDTYELTKITDAKYIMLLCDGTDSECQRYIVVTNSGNMYYTNKNLSRIRILNDFDNEFTKFGSKLKNITDIGYTKNAIPSAQESLVIKDNYGDTYLVNFITNKIKRINAKVVDAENNTSEEKTTPKELYNTTIDIQDYIEKVTEDKDYAKYNLDLEKVFKDKNLHNDIEEDYNISLKYEINGNNIQMKLIDTDAFIEYKLYLNNKYVDDISVFPDITFERLGKYLIYHNGVCTDIRCGDIYVYDNTTKVMTLNEFDSSNKGLVKAAHEYDVAGNNGIVIRASRLGHNFTIYSNDTYYELLSKEKCQNALNELSNDLIVEATYTYKYENGVLNITPEISDKVTLKEYIDNSKEACNQE